MKRRGAVTFDNLPDEEPPSGPVPMDGPVEHTDYGWCWCQPTTIEVPPNGEIIVHRRTMDGPE